MPRSPGLHQLDSPPPPPGNSDVTERNAAAVLWCAESVVASEVSAAILDNSATSASRTANRNASIKYYRQHNKQLGEHAVKIETDLPQKNCAQVNLYGIFRVQNGGPLKSATQLGRTPRTCLRSALLDTCTVYSQPIFVICILFYH